MKSNKFPDNTDSKNNYCETVLNRLHYKISIILPVFNVEDYIRDALESIVRQSIGLKHLEVIMVDDCSTDKSGEIIDEYASKYDNFIAIHLPENSGTPGKPRNVGMERATSDYIMFLDSDDYYAEDACEILYEKITKENAEMVLGKYNNVYDNGIIIQPPTKLFSSNYSEIKNLKSDNKELFYGVPASLWAKIFRRDFIEQNAIRFPEGIHGEDLAFVIHVFLKARIVVYINKIVINYHIRENEDKSITFNRTNRYITDLIQTYISIYHLYKENNQEEEFSHILLRTLPFWVKQLTMSDLTSYEKKRALKLGKTLFKKYHDFNLEPPSQFKEIFELIFNKKFDEAILLMDQMFYLRKKELSIRLRVNREIEKRKEIVDQIKESQTEIKSSQKSLKEMKNTLNQILLQNEDLKAQYYEMQYQNNQGRPLLQRLISWFPSLYILLKMRRTGIKNNLINIKGYHSIKKNHLLDMGYYLKNNRDVRLSGQDPIIHYIYYGYKEGQKPNPTFNGENYYKNHVDVKNQKLNPLVHYSLYGVKEGRKV